MQAIIAWSWARHPGTTEQFAGSLLDHVDLLKDFPYLGARLKRYRGVRRFVHSPLHVYYRINETRRVIAIPLLARFPPAAASVMGLAEHVLPDCTRAALPSGTEAEQVHDPRRGDRGYYP
ncbi:MAG: type II toxin-antitoxin system RelE/ParE family toxin [Acidobacteriia bacterium]|nr:type II toxin-antitoxin system RelE/ParE family toxin [Terriglobia bacterium]